MRLVQLAPFASVYGGSFIPMLRAVLSTARRRGYDVLAVFLESARGCEWLADFDREQLPYCFARGSDQKSLERVLGTPGHAEGSILHSHFTAFDFACSSFARADARSTAFWHVHSAHGRGSVAFARNVVRYAVLSRGVAEVLCVSPNVEREVRRRLAPSDRVRFFPNAIDTDRFTPATSQERAAARARIRVAPDVSVLLHFAWDWEIKGGEILLAATAQLRALRQPVAVVTVEATGIARRRASELNIDDAVYSVEPTNDVRALYAAADILVMPSGAEGMPFAIAEALASGVSVVATDAPGQRYIAEGLAATRLVPRDAGAVALGIESLLARDSAARARDADAARASVVSRLDLLPWAERLVDLYDAYRSDRR